MHTEQAWICQMRHMKVAVAECTDTGSGRACGIRTE